MTEQREAGIEEAHDRERVWYGKRKADREARRRRKELKAEMARRERELWTPAVPREGR
jgi:hypothetical protein